MIVDSPMNWPISCRRNAPSTLRMPTSCARPAERAVARFMKLMQAINRRKNATAEKM